MQGVIKYIIFIFCLIMLTTCVVPFEVPVSQLKRDYTVSGIITDNPGPYSVKMAYSSAYAKDVAGYNQPVLGAWVTINDEESGEHVTLTYQKAGVYVSDSLFRGKVNHHYHLRILTIEGDMLVSKPELLPPLNTVVTTHHEYVNESDLNPEGDKVWITMTDDPGEANYYRWKYEGVYRFSTFSWMVDPHQTYCWRYEYFNTDLMLASDHLINGKSFKQDITVVPYFSSTPYLLTIYTLSLTEEAYNFWNLVERQINNSGGIFDSPPSDIQGNLYCVNDPKKEVLGYFGASSMIKSQVFLTHEGYPRPLHPLVFDSIPCVEYSHAQLVTCCPTNYPDGWEH